MVVPSARAASVASAGYVLLRMRFSSIEKLRAGERRLSSRADECTLCDAPVAIGLQIDPRPSLCIRSLARSPSAGALARELALDWHCTQRAMVASDAHNAHWRRRRRITERGNLVRVQPGRGVALAERRKAAAAAEKDAPELLERREHGAGERFLRHGRQSSAAGRKRGVVQGNDVGD